MNILVVDDVPVVRKVVVRVLQRAGYTVYEAEDGVQALRSLERQPVQMLISDIWMPGGDGFALISQAHQKYPAMAIIAMSGGNPHATMTHSLREAEKGGASVLLMKPIDNHELLAAVEKAAGKVGGA